MDRSLSVIILAAGRGSRLRRDLYASNSKTKRSYIPKPLQPICGKPIIEWLIESLLKVIGEEKEIMIVVGVNQRPFHYLAEKYAEVADIRLCTQLIPDGTGGAVRAAMRVFFGTKSCTDDTEKVLICPGDVPFINEKILREYVNGSQEKVNVLGMEIPNPTGYGRLKISEDGKSMTGIVEEKDCNEKEREIKICNSGFLLANVGFLRDKLLPHMSKENNIQKEYYLTECVAIARNRWKEKVGYHICDERTCEERYFYGVNRLEELEALQGSKITDEKT